MRNDSSAEYLSDRVEPPSEPSNGQKKFDLKPAKDPSEHVIIRAREDAVTDPELTDGARNLFTFLLDLANNPYVNNGRKGQIAISNTQLCERLTRSSRAIYGWTKELEEQRHIWVSKLPRPNMHAMNVFHITAQQPKREIRQELPGDGMWGNGYRRPDQVMPLGARGATCKKRHYLFDRFGNPMFVETLDNRAPSRMECPPPPQNLREAPAQNDTSHPQNLREEPAKFAGGTRTKRHLPPAKNDTRTPQKTAVLRESQIEIETPVLKGKAPAPPSRAVWERRLEKMFEPELRRLKADLVRQQREADQGDNALIADISIRIEAIDRHLYGGAVPKKKPTRSMVPTKPAAKVDPTQDDIIEGARYLVSIGKGNLLTEAQKAALGRL